MKSVQREGLYKRRSGALPHATVLQAKPCVWNVYRNTAATKEVRGMRTCRQTHAMEHGANACLWRHTPTGLGDHADEVGVTPSMVDGFSRSDVKIAGDLVDGHCATEAACWRIPFERWVTATMVNKIPPMRPPKNANRLANDYTMCLQLCLRTHHVRVSYQGYVKLTLGA